MATPAAPTAPALTGEAALAAVQSAARARLDAAGNADAAAPSAPTPPAPAVALAPTPAAAAPVPAAAPPVPPAQPAAAAPPATPGGPPAATPPASITIDVSKLTPEAKRFLEMHGNDPAAALAKGLEYNNRLGHRGETAAPTPGAPTEPTAAPAATAPPAPPALTPEQLDQRFQQELAQRVDADTTLSEYVTEYGTLHERHKVVGLPLEQGGKGEMAILQRKVIGIENLLEHAKGIGDEALQETTARDLREAKTDLATLRGEAQEIRLRSKELSGLYDERFAKHRDVVQQRFDAVGEQAAADERVTLHATEFEQSWTPAVTAAIRNNKIPEKLLPRFEQRAREAALVAIDTQRGNPIKDVAGFLDAQAKEFLSDLDVYHRDQSAIYATGATERAGGATAVPGAAPTVTVQPPTRPPSNDPLQAVYSRASTQVRAMLRGA